MKEDALAAGVDAKQVDDDAPAQPEAVGRTKAPLAPFT
jgi:hypothetical protein